MSRIRIELEPDEHHPHDRLFESESFLVFWRDQFGTIRFVAYPDEEEEWIELMDGISEGKIAIFEEDEPDTMSGDDRQGHGG